jgi:monoamine oxidase
MRRRTFLSSLLGATALATPALARPIGRRVASHDAPERVDAIVIGAGFAGLTAARTLARAGRRVIMVEARDRVGGRTKAGRIAGVTIDLGGQWVGLTQTHLLALAAEYGVATYDTDLNGRCIAEVDGHRAEGNGEDFLGVFDLFDKLAFKHLVESVTEMAAEVPLDAPWSAPRAAEWDAMSLDEWMQRETGRKRLHAALRVGLGSVFGAEPSELSLLYFLFYIRSGDSLPALLSCRGGAQEKLFVGGVHQLSARMATELGSSLVLEAPVDAIVQEGERVRVHAGRRTWEARAAIVAVPPPLTTRIAWHPALPPERDALVQRMPMAVMMKFFAAYPRPFWRDHGWNGFAFSTETDLSPVFEMTPPGAPAAVLTGFVDCGRAVAFRRLSPERQREKVVADLRHYFGAEAAAPIEVVGQSWLDEEWSRGGPVAFAPPATLTRFGAALRTPVGRIHWAGTETSDRWSGYIDGAIRSGERAAREVSTRLDAEA